MKTDTDDIGRQATDILQRAALELPHLIDQPRLNEWLLDVFHGGEVACFHCGQGLSQRAQRSYMKRQITSCCHCGLKSQLFRGTLIHGAKIAPGQFLVLAALLSVGAKVQPIAKVLKLSESCVREWQKKLNPDCVGKYK